MTDYYTAPNGTASWEEAQNIDTPCSLQTAGANAKAGDTVYLRGGTYVLPFCVDEVLYWKIGFHPVNSGTSENPIIFMAYPNETPFLDNSINANQPNAVSSYGVRYQDYIIFDGLNTKSAMSNGASKAVVVNRTTGTIIRNADIQASDEATTNNSSIRVENANNCIIENNILHGAHQAGGPHHNSAAYMLYDSNNILVQNNTIYDSDCALFDKQGGNHNKYCRNYVYDCSMGFQTSSIGPSTGDINVYQNIFRNISGWGIAVAGADEDPINGIKFYNNTLSNVHEGINTGGLGINRVDNAEIFNNIVFSASIGVHFYADHVSFMDYNNYNSVIEWRYNGMWDGTIYTSLVDWQAATGFDLNSNTNNPNFLNPSGIYPEDYKRTSYPLDGRGGIYPSVMGAYITGNEIIGASILPVITPPPSEVPPMITPIVTNLTFSPSIIKDNMNWMAITTIQNYNDFPIENVQVGFFISEVPDTIIHTIEAITIPASTTIDLETTFEPWQASQYHLCAKVLGE